MNRFFWSVVLIWLGLVFTKLFGFDFGVDLKIILKIIFLFLIFFLARAAAKNWTEVKAILKDIWTEVKAPINKDLLQYRRPFERKVHLPFVVIRHFLRVGKRILFDNFLLFFCLAGILFDIFLVTSLLDVIIFIFILIWIFVIKIHKFEGRTSFVGGLIFLAVCPFLLIFRKGNSAEKAAIWGYLFLTIGSLQMFIKKGRDERKRKK